jgi:hypothetical protein
MTAKNMTMEKKENTLVGKLKVVKTRFKGTVSKNGNQEKENQEKSLRLWGVYLNN